MQSLVSPNLTRLNSLCNFHVFEHKRSNCELQLSFLSNILHFLTLAEREDSKQDERRSDESRLHQVQRGRQQQGDGPGRRHRVRGRGVQVGRETVFYLSLKTFFFCIGVKCDESGGYPGHVHPDLEAGDGAAGGGHGHQSHHG